MKGSFLIRSSPFNLGTKETTVLPSMSMPWLIACNGVCSSSTACNRTSRGDFAEPECLSAGGVSGAPELVAGSGMLVALSVAISG